MFFRIGFAEVDLINLEHREVALAVLRCAYFAGNAVAGAQIESPDLTRRDIYVIGSGKIRAVGGAQKAEPVLQNFQCAFAVNVFAGLRLFPHYRGDDFLLACACSIFQAHFTGHIDEVADWLGFQFFKIHRHVE